MRRDFGQNLNIFLELVCANLDRVINNDQVPPKPIGPLPKVVPKVVKDLLDGTSVWRLQKRSRHKPQF